jgi:hypothetical protein
VQRNAIEVARHMGTGTYPTRRPFWAPGTNTLTLWKSQNPQQASGTCYLETSKIGRVDKKTKFRRVTPLLWQRTNISGGTPSAALVYTLFEERPSVSASVTSANVSEGGRQRFDFMATHTFGVFRVTYTDIFTEVEDFLVDAIPAGTD